MKQDALSSYVNRKLHKLLKGTAPLSLDPVIQGESWGYRRRARLAARYHRQQKQFELGFRSRGEKRITQVDNCAVLEPSLQSLPKRLRDFLQSADFVDQIGHIELVQQPQRPGRY